jgi:hypothetical protein
MVLDGYDVVDVSLNCEFSVDDSLVSFVRCVTGHIVVSSGFIAGIDSSSDDDATVDDDKLTGDGVVYSKN